MTIATPTHSGFSMWLTARLGEPESRGALALAATLLAAYVGQSISLHVLGYGLLTALIAFVLPGPIAAPVISAIEKETGLPATIIPSVWTPQSMPIHSATGAVAEPLPPTEPPHA